MAGQQRIDLSAQARSHPLFPILDYTARTVCNQQKQLDILEKKISSLEDTQKELEKLLKTYGESNFQIEKSSYQSPLRRGLAELYCNSLFRNPSEDNIIRLVKSVLRNDTKLKYKGDAAMKYVSGLVSTFRSEERRRVLNPSGKYKNQPTKSLATLIMKYMKAPQDSFESYYKNLVLLRKYIRTVPSVDSQKNMFQGFKNWVSEKFHISDESSCSAISNSEWQELITEDEQYNYCSPEMHESLEELNEEEVVIETDNSLVETEEVNSGYSDLYNFV